MKRGSVTHRSGFNTPNARAVFQHGPSALVIGPDAASPARYFEDSRAYYKEAMALGRLRVNGEEATEDYRCRDGDVITHKVHRHEPPISSAKVLLCSPPCDGAGPLGGRDGEVGGRLRG